MNHWIGVVLGWALLLGAWAGATPQADIPWPNFLQKHDLVWEKPPVRWEEAPYFGNGNMGSMLYLDEKNNRLQLQVFRVDVQDHRDNSHGWTAYSRPRLMIGSFFLQPVGKITGGNWRQSLWNAEVVGDLVTDKGRIDFRHLVHAAQPVMATFLETEGEEKGAKWTWEPAEARTTRPGYPSNEAELKGFANRYGRQYLKTLKVPYRPNPAPVVEKRGEATVSVQDLLAAGQHVVAWREEDWHGGRAHLVCIEKTFPERTAEQKAIQHLAAAVERRPADWLAQHRRWWHVYYPKSFVSLPDARMETIYWHQIYKLAAAGRADGPMLDTAGPWLQPTPWPYITWDLNVQLCYWPVCASNHLDIGQSLLNTLWKNRENMRGNVRPTSWQKDSSYLPVTTAQDLIAPRTEDRRYYDCVGNLPWALHNAWLINRHAMDDKQLREKIVPLMKRGFNFYRHMLSKDEQGRYHLPVTYSPEAGKAPDCNYDLALLKWTSWALLQANGRLRLNDPQASVWRDVYENLTDFPVDENGLMLGAGVPWDQSHRHYSHLLAIYPLYLINIDQGPEAKELIKKSLEHWISYKGALQGYSFTGASSIAAAMGDGDAALKYLSGLERFLQPNGLYKESGPVMETPLSAAQSVHDMLLQSWGKVVRPFPAAPSAWPELSFYNLRAQGGFDVSARRVGGKTVQIDITSQAGKQLFLKPGFDGPFEVKSSRPMQVNEGRRRPGVFRINLKKGETVTLLAKGTKPQPVRPVAKTSGKANSFGVKVKK